MNTELQEVVTVHSRVLQGMHALPISITAFALRLLNSPYVVLGQYDRSRINARLQDFQTGLIDWPDEVNRQTFNHLRQAFEAAGLEFPTEPYVLRIPQPHEPGDPSLQLPLAVALLSASGQLPAVNLSKYEFYGELSHEGDMGTATAAPLLAQVAASRHVKRCAVVPKDSLDLYPCATQARLLIVKHLAELCLKLRQGAGLNVEPLNPQLQTPAYPEADLSQFAASAHAVSTLVCAAAGGHAMLVHEDEPSCPSPSEKVAECIRALLPPLTAEEAFVLVQLRSSNFMERHELRRGARHITFGERPLEQLYVGYDEHLFGDVRQPGLLSLAHQGLLRTSLWALNHLTELGQRKLLSSLEAGTVGWPIDGNFVPCFPAQTQLIIKYPGKNLCPCGTRGTRCSCAPKTISPFRERALRLGIINRCVLRLTPEQCVMRTASHGTAALNTQYLERIAQARARQLKRNFRLNAQLTPGRLDALQVISAAAEARLTQAAAPFNPLQSFLHGVRTVALTLADLDSSAVVDVEHMDRAVALCGLGVTP
jgi:magnesium chelatase family protein